MTDGRALGRSGSTVSRPTKQARQRQMRDLVARHAIASQEQFVDLLAESGFAVTQATVSRDIGELGLVKVVRDGRHVYSPPAEVGLRRASDESLRRVLASLPTTIRRSGLILLLVSTPGSASAIAEAIDQSTLTEQEGTIAGDNTVLVLFEDEQRLERWRSRLEEIRGGRGA